MKILVLGGTRFVGRAIVEAALGRDHEITLFNRGTTDPDAFRSAPNVHHVRGDRTTDDAEVLATTQWECVVDVSAYRPDAIRPVLRTLCGQAPHYLYISTVSVYQPSIPRGSDESAPLLDVDEAIPPSDPHAYGGLKALCERELRAALDDRLTVVRPTVVIGPRDPTDRFTWWVRQIAGAARLHVPRRLDQPVQLIDSRDLGLFVVRCVEEEMLGTFNAVGPAQAITFGAMIDVVAEALAVSPHLVPAAPGTHFPLMLPEQDPPDGVFSVSGAAAYGRGLTLRPIGESAVDILHWDRV